MRADLSTTAVGGGGQVPFFMKISGEGVRLFLTLQAGDHAPFDGRTIVIRPDRD